LGNRYDCDFLLTGDDVTVVSSLDSWINPSTDGPPFAPFSGGTVSVTNGSNAITLTGNQTTIAASIATGSQTVTPASMTGIVLGSLLNVANSDGSHLEAVTVTAVTGSTFTATFATKTGPGITVTVWCQWFPFLSRGSFSTDGGSTDYTIIAMTGLNSATLDRAYTGATNATATYSITSVPVRAFVQTGVNTSVLNLSQPSDATLALQTTIEGIPPLRLIAQPGATVNPYVAFVNGAQQWNLLFPGVGGIVPGGIALYDYVTGHAPLKIQPGAADESLILTPTGPTCSNPAAGPYAVLTGSGSQTITNKTLGPFNATILSPDGTGNVPNSFAPNTFYLMYVNGLADFPAGTYGSVIGYASGLSASYNWQLFHPADGSNKLYLRTATSVTAWGSWIDLTAASLPNVGTPGTYTKVTTDAEGRVSSGAQAASTDLSDSSALVRLQTQTSYSGNGSGDVLALLVGTGNPPSGMYRVSAYIYNTTTATGNLTVEASTPT